jgi:plastocyanin
MKTNMIRTVSISAFVVALYVLSLIALTPNNANAQAQIGTCGGVAVTGINNSTCMAITQQCASTHRVYGSYSTRRCTLDGDYYGNDYGGCTYDPSCANPPPNVSFGANPSTIYRGDATSITWNASNAVSCTGSGFSTGGAVSGSVSVTPQVNTDYSVTCTNAIGTNASQYLTVAVNDPPFIATCSPNRSTARVGDSVTWTATAQYGLAPYMFTWAGEKVSQMTGSSVTVSYDTTGSKSASVTARDSFAGGAGFAGSYSDDRRCSGPQINSTDYSAGHEEDLGNQQENIDHLKRIDMYDTVTGQNQWNGNPPSDVIANPQNYCIEGRLRQACDPQNHVEGSGICRFAYSVTVHSGSGTRAATSADYGNSVNSCGPLGCSPGWRPNRYFGTLTGSISPGVPRTSSNVCSAEVAVSAAPTINFTADPVSIIGGQSSLLRWTSTNATSCTSADFTTGNAPQNTTGVSVTPPATRTYTISCTGPGGTTNAQATISVTPALTASCSVSPATATVGQAVTWTATASGGTGIYSYSWSGEGVTGATTQQVSPSYPSPGVRTASVRVISGGQDTGFIACNNSASISGQVNLTPSIGPAVAAVAGQPATFTGSTLNNGNIAAAAGFNDLFVFYEADQATWQGYQRVASDAIAAGGTAPRSISYTFPNPGTYYYRLCSDWDGNVGESNEGDNCSALSPVTVTPPARPDLTPIGLSPRTVVAQQPSTFTATLRNDGNAVTPNFSSTLFVCPQGDQACQNNILAKGAGSFFQKIASFFSRIAQAATAIPITMTGGVIPAQTSGTQTGQYNFPSAGTYIMRLCADLPGNQVTESNENNNCGNWEVLAVCAPGSTIDGAGNCVPPTVSCTASPSSINLGQSVTFTANPSPGAVGPYTWEDSDGWGPQNTPGTSISRTYANPPIPLTGGTFQMRVKAANTAYANCTPQVSVQGVACAGPATVDITANPTRVQQGANTTLNWTASNVPGYPGTCTVTSSPGGVYSANLTASAPATGCVLPPSGNPSVRIDQQTTFTINCGGVTDSVTVNIIPKFQEF